MEEAHQHAEEGPREQQKFGEDGCEEEAFEHSGEPLDDEENGPGQKKVAASAEGNLRED